jgi:hypothetical protein
MQLKDHIVPGDCAVLKWESGNRKIDFLFSLLLSFTVEFCISAQ